jgi:hypothetical protein
MVDRFLIGSSSTLRYIREPPLRFILKCHLVAGAVAPGSVCPGIAHPLIANGCTLFQSDHPMITSGWRTLASLRSLLDLTYSSVLTPSARNTNRGSPDSLNRTW